MSSGAVNAAINELTHTKDDIECATRMSRAHRRQLYTLRIDGRPHVRQPSASYAKPLVSGDQAPASWVLAPRGSRPTAGDVVADGPLRS